MISTKPPFLNPQTTPHMRVTIILSTLLLSSMSFAQSGNQLSDSVLYNPGNYSASSSLQTTSNFAYEITYTHSQDAGYKMKRVFLDSAQTKLVSKSFYHQNKLHGPYESYAMNKLQAKGRYKNGKLDGERLTYYNGGIVQEKASFKNGKRDGVWEYYSPQGLLKRRVTYNNNGTIEKDEQY